VGKTTLRRETVDKAPFVRTRRKSFAPVEEDDDEGAREGERQFLGGVVEWRVDSLRRGWTSAPFRQKIKKEGSVYVCQTAKALSHNGRGKSETTGTGV
jgi:hypothetical protein